MAHGGNDPDRAPTPRGSLRLVLDGTFGPFFFGRLLSTVGIWVHNIAAAIVVYDLTGSASFVGLVSVAQFAPQLLLTPMSGAMADRGDRRRQVVVGRLVTAAGSFGLVGWSAAVGLEGVPGAVAVVAAALVVGIGFALGGPALQAMIPSLVRPSELAPAVALSSAPFTVARASGPALGAALVTTGGPTLAFAVAGAANLLFTLVIALLRIRPLDHPPPRDSSVRAGLRHIRADRLVLTIILGTAALGISLDPIITLSPPIADGLGGGSWLVGALASAFGVGAAATFLLLGWLRRVLGLALMSSWGLAVMAAGMLGLAAAASPSLALLAMGVGGVGMTLSVTSLSTQVQERVPEELRGRVMAVWMVAFLGSRPVAAALNGAVADAFSPAAALAIVSAVASAAAWQLRPARQARLRALPGAGDG